jgi:hypothetical protein
MNKMRAEMPNTPQQSHLEMDSNALATLDVARRMGEGCTSAAGRVISGCIFIMFTAGFGRMATRSVSFFGLACNPTGTLAPWSGSEPTGFGNGCESGDVAGCGGKTGGRCDELTEDSAAGSTLMGERDLIVGGDRRSGIAGVLEGKTILAVSRSAPPFCGPCWVSGLGGSAMRTVSFFGSAMTGHVAPRKIAEISFLVTR